MIVSLQHFVRQHIDNQSRFFVLQEKVYEILKHDFIGQAPTVIKEQEAVREENGNDIICLEVFFEPFQCLLGSQLQS